MTINFMFLITFIEKKLARSANSMKFPVCSFGCLLISLLVQANVFGQYTTIDWTHLTKAPQRVDEIVNGNKVVLLVNELDLGNLDYSNWQTGKDLVLIANKIELTDIAQIHLVSRNTGTPTITIVAKELIVREDGVLSIYTSGKFLPGQINIILGKITHKESFFGSITNTKRFGYYSRKHGFDRYEDRRLHFINNVLNTDVLNLGPSSGVSSGPGFSMELQGRSGHALKGALELSINTVEEPDIPERHPSPGQIFLSLDYQQAQQYVPSNYMSLWTIKILENLYTRIRNAEFNSNFPLLKQLINRSLKV